MATKHDSAQIEAWELQKTFILAGDAIFTLVSLVTGTRYTFRVQRPKPRTAGEDVSNKWFAKLLAGPDNLRDYKYLGMVTRKGETLDYVITRAAKLPADSAPQKAIRWIVMHLNADKPFPAELEFYHVGRCGACGRALTVPESIESGLGPVCAGRV